MPEVTEVVAESAPEAVVDISGASLGAIRKMLAKETAEEPEEVEAPVTEAKPAKAAPKVETEPDSEPDDDQESAKGEVEKPQSQNGINKKFAKMSGKIRDLEAQLANRPAAAEVKPGVAIPPVVDAGAPKIADFDDYEKYLDARTDYRVAQTEKARVAKAAEAANAEAWTAASKDAREKYDDFDEIVGQDIPISRAVNDAIQESSVRAELAYFLGKNPAEVARINALSPTRAGAEIAKIEATLVKAAPEKPKPATVKPPPKPPAIVTAGSTPAPSTDLSDPNMSMDRFKEIVSKNLKRRW
jgi:hypothetical protein